MFVSILLFLFLFLFRFRRQWFYRQMLQHLQQYIFTWSRSQWLFHLLLRSLDLKSSHLLVRDFVSLRSLHQLHELQYRSFCLFVDFDQWSSFSSFSNAFRSLYIENLLSKNWIKKRKNKRLKISNVLSYKMILFFCNFSNLHKKSNRSNLQSLHRCMIAKSLSRDHRLLSRFFLLFYFCFSVFDFSTISWFFSFRWHSFWIFCRQYA